MKRFLLTAATLGLLITAAQASPVIPTSAEEDLRTGDVSIKNKVDAECGRQVMQGGDSACAKAWHEELQQKLSNPQWRAIFQRRLDAIVNQ